MGGVLQREVPGAGCAERGAARHQRRVDRGLEGVLLRRPPAPRPRGEEHPHEQAQGSPQVSLPYHMIHLQIRVMISCYLILQGH